MTPGAPSGDVLEADVLEMWAGSECTMNRIADHFHDHDLHPAVPAGFVGFVGLHQLLVVAEHLDLEQLGQAGR